MNPGTCWGGLLSFWGLVLALILHPPWAGVVLLLFGAAITARGLRRW